MDNNEIGGVWRTIGKRKVFIKNGQDLKTAMKESGKFKKITFGDIQHENNHDIINKKQKTLEEILNDQELKCLTDYVSSDSYKINEKLYDEMPLTPEDKEFIKNMDSALDKLPKYKGIVNRSVFVRDQEHLNKILSVFNNENLEGSWSSYLSCSKNVYDENDDLRFIIKSKTGRDVSMFNINESEVIFKRNTKFRIISSYNKDKKLYIELEEV